MAETMEMTETRQYKLREVRIRLEEGRSLLSAVPMSNPEAAMDVMRRELSGYDREVLCVVNLNSRLQPINFHVVSVGDLSQSIAFIPNILKSGILSNAQSFMLLHNHPSGDVTPSREDIQLTRRQVQLAPEMQTGWLKDYDQVKEHLFIRVSDAKENEAFLAMSPHKEVDGLAISYHIAFEGLHGVEASTPVSYKMMEMYGVTAEQLHADALESSQRLYPVKFRSMNEIMAEMMGMEPDMAADMMPPMEGPQLMVLTNMQGMHGAGAMFYPDQLETIAQQMGTDFFVLPSSVHEVLILPDDGTTEPDSLQFMVREINQSTVAPEDRLSDFVYHYDAQDHVLERAETFAARMAQKEQEAEKAALQELPGTGTGAERADQCYAVRPSGI